MVKGSLTVTVTRASLGLCKDLFNEHTLGLRYGSSCGGMQELGMPLAPGQE